MTTEVYLTILAISFFRGFMRSAAGKKWTLFSLIESICLIWIATKSWQHAITIALVYEALKFKLEKWLAQEYRKKPYAETKDKKTELETKWHPQLGTYRVKNDEGNRSTEILASFIRNNSKAKGASRVKVSPVLYGILQKIHDTERVVIEFTEIGTYDGLEPDEIAFSNGSVWDYKKIKLLGMAEAIKKETV